MHVNRMNFMSEWLFGAIDAGFPLTASEWHTAIMSEWLLGAIDAGSPPDLSFAYCAGEEGFC